MATVKVRKRKKGTVYCAEVRIKGFPQLSQAFDRKSEALRWERLPTQGLEMFRHQMERGPRPCEFESSTQACAANQTSTISAPRQSTGRLTPDAV
jgi:hypothetical protein